MLEQIVVTKTNKHLVIKIPLEEVAEKEEIGEEEVLKLADRGLQEYTAGKTESFQDFISRKYPEYRQFIG